MGIPARLSGHIDLDFLPIARQIIKDYAVKKYTNVCSVGNWNTYNPKMALQDAYRAHGGNVHEVTAITTKLPNEFDELTLEDHDKFFINLNSPDAAVRQLAHMEISKYQQFYDFRNAHREIVDIAYKMVGKIKSQGTHAGGLIIADRPISELVPLSLIKSEESKNWTSQWTEGSTPQLSKFGLVKFDILGLKTMQYIWQACNHIKKTRGITIDWSEMNPKADPPFIGHEINTDGIKKIILLNDPLALKMCNDLKTQSVFQIETDIQKGIISDGKVKSFWDLVAYNALGRPGPIECIPKGSLINTLNGFKTIENLDYEKDSLLYYSNQGLKYTNQYAVIRSGQKKIYKIKLSNGKTIRLSGNHKLFSKQGIRSVKNLKNGDVLYAKGGNDLEEVVILSIEEDGEEECYDISNYEDDCLDNEGNFFCDDILVHNCIPDYIARRDDPNQGWKNGVDKRITNILSDTFNVIVYQESLTAIWIQLAGFTVPEAEAARKIIAKKWTEKLPVVEKQWKDGASKSIGIDEVNKWWDLMYTFGRYAFNKCISKDMVIVDSITNNEKTIGNIKPGDHLKSIDDNGCFFDDEVIRLIDSGEQEIYEVEFDNGIKQELTMDHKLQCGDGEFRTVKEILEGDFDVRTFDNIAQ